MIYTLDYLRTEANQIASSWDGTDEKGEDARNAAEELLGKLNEVDALIAELKI